VDGERRHTDPWTHAVLDDNTYTNKTWAEVSGISVTEIHIMEVEFLSNMRYDLYASEAEWSEWRAKLGRFGAFYEKAARLPLADEVKSTAPVTPTSQNFPHKLPSPPSTHHGTGIYGSTMQAYPALPNPMSTVPHFPPSPLRQQRVSSGGPLERKRSHDLTADQPPAKRPHYPTSTQGPVGGILTPTAYTPGGLGGVLPPGPADSMMTPNSLDIPRLPAPRLPTTTVSHNTQTQLAPLAMPIPRAMSAVYPNTSTAWSQQLTPISAVPASLYQNPIPNLGDGPRSGATTYPSAHASPSHVFGATTTPTLPGLSPSYFLIHRSSPYRPVRHVNTLLIPPPSAALQNPPRSVAPDQIHYQPLGKAVTERRTGPVPYFQPDGWYQSNVSTPIVGQQLQY